MKVLVFIAVIGCLLAPVLGAAAMREMPDDTLSQVEGDSIAHYQQGRSLELRDSSTQAYPATSKNYSLPDKELFLFDNEIQALKQSREYETFLLLFGQLEQIAARGDYRDNLDSKGFLTLCYRIAAVSQDCSKKLSLLENSLTCERIKSLVHDKRKLLEVPTHFYRQLAVYQKEKAQAPDLERLINDIRYRHSKAPSH